MRYLFWFMVMGIIGETLLGVGLRAIAQPTRLTPDDVTVQMQTLSDWSTDGQQLTCTYGFGNFVEAIAFVNELVQPAEALGHHPDLTITYNRVAIHLTTHDAGGLSMLDFDLAREISHRADPNRCAPSDHE